MKDIKESPIKRKNHKKLYSWITLTLAILSLSYGVLFLIAPAFRKNTPIKAGSDYPMGCDYVEGDEEKSICRTFGLNVSRLMYQNQEIKATISIASSAILFSLFFILQERKIK